MIEQETLTSPYLRSIGEKAELISTLYKQRQETTQMTLDELKTLIEEMARAQQQEANMQMSPEVFTVYWMLQGEGITAAAETARLMTPLFETYPHWRTSEEHERRLKQDMLKVLIQAKVQHKQASTLTQRVMKILREGGQT